jgi:hypothetical protein
MIKLWTNAQVETIAKIVAIGVMMGLDRGSLLGFALITHWLAYRSCTQMRCVTLFGPPDDRGGSAVETGSH